MTKASDEERQPRSAALQNAQTIQLARQRAEDALSEAKVSLEVHNREIAQVLAMMHATLEATTDGIMVTDRQGRITAFNRKLALMWHLPEGALVSGDHASVLRSMSIEFQDPGAFMARVDEICTSSPSESSDVLELLDGTVLLRSSRTQISHGQDVGRVWSFRDITKRRRVERALQERTEVLRVILASIGDAVIATDDKGAVTFMNGIAESLTGSRLDEALCRPLQEIFHVVHETSREPIELPAMRALREDAIAELPDHSILVALDGTERPIDDSASPMRDRSGNTIGTVLIFRDATERKRAEELRSRLAAIVESSDDAIISKTLDGVITSWNSGAEGIFGYNEEEAIGQPITLIIPPERRGEEVSILERLRRGERVDHFETVRVTKEGRRVDISVTISPIHDEEGNVVGVSKVARDVSERKQVEADMRERDERLQLFLGNATDYAVIMTDREGHVLEWLAGAEAITGWSEEDVRGGSLDVIYSEEDRADGVLAFQMEDVCRYGRAVDQRWHVQRDGTRFFADGVTTCLRTAEGEVRGFFKVLRDDTERKLAEDALRDSDRRKDEFLALLAHELRNPLAPLRNGLQVMRLAADDPDTVAQARDMMERQLRHMIHLIDDLLDISRMSQDKLVLRRELVLLETIVAGAVETSRPSIEQGGHQLILSLPTEPVRLDGDLTRLSQILSNLLVNSAKYTQPGGHIWLSAVLEGSEAVVSVRDDGIGIPAQALPGLFEQFSQVDRTLERSTGGLGIGLALAKNLTEMHGGTIGAASDGPGQGSTFTVRLPVAQGGIASASGRREGGELASTHRRILVVDDNRDSADTMAKVLGLLGNEVRTAHDGLEALATAGEFRPSVILMDVGMPMLNGYDSARRIRQQPWGKDMTIIALTGWGQHEDRMQSRDAGCDGHLVKPVDFTDLERLIADLQPR